MAKNFKVKLRNGTKDTIVKFKRNEKFKASDKISDLEKELGKALGNKNLKEAYGLKNKKTYSLESDKTFKECFDASSNTYHVIDALNSNDTSLVAFIAKMDFNVKLKNGTKDTIVNFTRDEEFKDSDTISDLEKELGKARGKDTKLKEAYGLKNKKTYPLESNQTLKNCFPSQGAGVLNDNETWLIAFIPEE